MRRGKGREINRQTALLKLPGNDVCADCLSRNPTWSSTNLGVLICTQCAGIHRHIGVHISFVQSVTMDNWKPGMVERVEAIGNSVAAHFYEHDPTAENSRCQPSDVELTGGDRLNADTAKKLESWILAKYVHLQFAKPSVDPPHVIVERGEDPRVVYNFSPVHSGQPSARTQENRTKRKKKKSVSENDVDFNNIFSKMDALRQPVAQHPFIASAPPSPSHNYCSNPRNPGSSYLGTHSSHTSSAAVINSSSGYAVSSGNSPMYVDNSPPVADSRSILCRPVSAVGDTRLENIASHPTIHNSMDSSQPGAIYVRDQCSPVVEMQMEETTATRKEAQWLKQITSPKTQKNDQLAYTRQRLIMDSIRMLYTDPGKLGLAPGLYADIRPYGYSVSRGVFSLTMLLDKEGKGPPQKSAHFNDRHSDPAPEAVLLDDKRAALLKEMEELARKKIEMPDKVSHPQDRDSHGILMRASAIPDPNIVEADRRQRERLAGTSKPCVQQRMMIPHARHLGPGPAYEGPHLELGAYRGENPDPRSGSQTVRDRSGDMYRSDDRSARREPCRNGYPGSTASSRPNPAMRYDEPTESPGRYHADSGRYQRSAPSSPSIPPSRPAPSSPYHEPARSARYHADDGYQRSAPSSPYHEPSRSARYHADDGYQRSAPSSQHHEPARSARYRVDSDGYQRSAPSSPSNPPSRPAFGRHDEPTEASYRSRVYDDGYQRNPNPNPSSPPTHPRQHLHNGDPSYQRSTHSSSSPPRTVRYDEAAMRHEGRPAFDAIRRDGSKKPDGSEVSFQPVESSNRSYQSTKPINSEQSVRASRSPSPSSAAKTAGLSAVPETHGSSTKESMDLSAVLNSLNDAAHHISRLGKVTTDEPTVENQEAGREGPDRNVRSSDGCNDRDSRRGSPNRGYSDFQLDRSRDDFGQDRGYIDDSGQGNCSQGPRDDFGRDKNRQGPSGDFGRDKNRQGSGDDFGRDKNRQGPGDDFGRDKNRQGPSGDFGRDKNRQCSGDDFGRDKNRQGPGDDYGRENYGQGSRDDFRRDNYRQGYRDDFGRENYSQGPRDDFGRDNYRQGYRDDFGRDNYRQGPRDDFGRDNYRQGGSRDGKHGKNYSDFRRNPTEDWSARRVAEEDINILDLGIISQDIARLEAKAARLQR